MAGGQPEPERALEFLKKLEEFALKIEKAASIKRKSDKKSSDLKQSNSNTPNKEKENSFLNGKISPRDKRRSNHFSKASD